MIRSLLVPDYLLTEILSVFGMIAINTLIYAATLSYSHNITLDNNKYILSNTLVIATVIWGVSTSWTSLIRYDGWKILTDQDIMAQRLTQRNGTHLSMSGDSPFTRGALADEISKDGEGEAVDEILKGSYEMDLRGKDEATSSSEMHSFIKALKIPILK